MMMTVNEPNAANDAGDLLETLEITKVERRTSTGGAWVQGTMGGHRFDALVFPEHAEQPDYELDDSRISKLWVQRSSDRGLADERDLREGHRVCRGARRGRAHEPDRSADARSAHARDVLEEQAGPGEQQHRERDFEDDERAKQTPARTAAPLVFPQGLSQVRP